MVTGLTKAKSRVYNASWGDKRLKKTFVKDLRDGTRIDEVFLVASKSLRTTRTGAPFVRIELRDRTGSVTAVKWDAGGEFYEKVPDQTVIRVVGNVCKHDGNMQIIVEQILKPAYETDPADFLPRSARSSEEMLAELRAIISTIQNHHLRALLDVFFNNQDFVSRFAAAPAAQKIHHAYIGGLLEHTLSVAKLCCTAAEHYRFIDRDILITGAILHDIGKIEEFSWNGIIKYTDKGRFIGHIVGGARMVSDAIDTIEAFDPLLKMVMEHLILSHHGVPEFGAARLPQCLEAFVLHYLEDMDAKVNIVRDAITQTNESDMGLWTEKHFLFERSLFRGIPGESVPPAANSTEDLIEEDYNPFSEE